MNKLTIITTLVAACMALPQAPLVDHHERKDAGFEVINIPLSEIESSGISEKRDTSTIDASDLLRIQEVNALAELPRETRSTSKTTIKPKKLTLKDLIGRTAA
ncbi:uncharacterized protein LOC129946988 [Eupeodes corollae]|uniref:uncharacterized protein LOC129946988 n=1 Tax=Eupeodes corollae TaxID=290404 RepID=UPI00249069A3|nr:uncharacterized protein LOC129946988 [Eupeodes corollae]